MNRSVLPVVLLVWSFLRTMTGAEPVSENVLDESRVSYMQQEYMQTIRHLERIPNLFTAAPFMDVPDPQTRARIFWDLGRCYYALTDTARAETMLEYAVYLDPDVRSGVLSLDNDRAAAKARLFLESWRVGKINERLANTTVWKAAGRSLMFPGWGQIYRGHQVRGLVFSGAAAALGTALVLSVQSYNQAYDVYRATALEDLHLSEAHPPDANPFDTRYATVKSRAKRANIIAGALFAVWALNIADNFIVGPNQISVQMPIE